jgi:hypothetical protein
VRKIAVGDLGEFWYGDYKEPFVQLEGAVPGYPQGVVLKADDGKLLCAYCGKTFENLGRHANWSHGMSARDYKDEVGLLQKSALITEPMRQDRIRVALRNHASNNLPRKGDPNWRGRRSGVPQPLQPGTGIQSPERQNKTGTCYAQALAVARSLGQHLTQKRLSQHGIPPSTVVRLFVDMAGIRAQAGVHDGYRTWTRPELVSALRNLGADLGRSPRASDARRFGLPSFGTYKRAFGSWNAAVREAGFEPDMPMPNGVDTDYAVLLAYSTHGSIRRTATQLAMDVNRVAGSLHRYGFPFPPGGGGLGSARREWAADMARRLAGLPETTAA